MALSCRTLYRSFSVFRITKPVNQCLLNNVQRRLYSEVLCRPIAFPLVPVSASKLSTSLNLHRYCSDSRKKEQQGSNSDGQEKPLSLFQRFKQMYRDYWYVLVPVHIITSAVWLGGAYYLIVSGVDIIGTLESIGVSERIIEPMRDSKAGYVALTYALYKILTPLRYTVTLGGTTLAIRRLKSIGWIKPVPTKQEMREIFHAQKGNIQVKIKEQQINMHEKKTRVIDEVKRYKAEMKSLKNKIKKM